MKTGVRARRQKDIKSSFAAWFFVEIDPLWTIDAQGRGNDRQNVSLFLLETIWIW